MTAMIEMIKKLRAETGAGVMECRAALEQANANYDFALALLREKAAAAAAKRADRAASNGLLEVYSHGNGRIAVLVEVNTETDFAARSPLLRSFAHEVALQIAAAAPRYVRDEEIPLEVLEEEREKAACAARAQGKSQLVIQKVVEGRVQKYKDAAVLLRQVSIRDEKTTLAQMLSQAAASVGENVLIRRFVRWELEDAASR
jgi:elongation factor Ts